MLYESPKYQRLMPAKLLTRYLVLVAAGSIPTTTSGKIRRAACVEQYRNNEFIRLDTASE